MVSNEQIREIFARFSRQKALIIGDVMVDTYVRGKVERISPEAPVPVLAVSQRENLLGGAANVALNIKSLAATPILCSVVGNDEQGDLFLSLLEKENLPTTCICRSNQRSTTTKFRFIGNNAHLLRVDDEMTHDIAETDENILLGKIRDTLASLPIDVVIFQDYNKGVITPRIISEVTKMAKRYAIPITVDPKKKNFTAYCGVSLFKPNLKELKEGLNMDVGARNFAQLQQAAQKLHLNQQVDNVMFTLSESGIFMSSKQPDASCEAFTIPAHLRSITDVSGAGDTVISVASLCLAQQASPWLTAALSNLAGGLVCEFIGVVPVDIQRMQEEALQLNQ
ncbi:MAG: bifunctional ADP-heptose synthase [Lentimicrobiaceae bacterium]|nr:bifunctional ADP-heptose synthase [Lentimicrobiaceae bacterium]